MYPAAGLYSAATNNGWLRYSTQTLFGSPFLAAGLTFAGLLSLTA